jgi:hypothetical protein
MTPNPPLRILLRFFCRSHHLPEAGSFPAAFAYAGFHAVVDLRLLNLPVAFDSRDRKLVGGLATLNWT